MALVVQTVLDMFADWWTVSLEYAAQLVILTIE